MAKLAICVPTYGRQSALEELCQLALLQIHKRYGKDVDIFVRDNSIGLNGYDFSFVEDLFLFADYKLNASNLSYHGNVLELYNLCHENSYIWIWPDDDSYVLSSIFNIIDSILSGSLDADVILPAFSYTRRPDFISTKAILESLPAQLLDQEDLTAIYSTDFNELLSHSLYPYIPLTSSFIFKKQPTLLASHVIARNASNAWFHEVLMLASVDRFSSVQIIGGPPYVYYQEFYDSSNNPIRSGMNIEYFHENNIALNKLRAHIFNDKTLFNPRTCWRESVLWLVQDKDGTIAWTNNKIYSYKLVFRATLFSICNFDLWLFTLCICFLFVPSWMIKYVRRSRSSHHLH